MERLRCVVERITYQNEQNGYSVIKCTARGYSDLITAVGMMPEVHAGAVLLLEGNWKVDARYGRQFAIESFEETMPATVHGIEKYLGSGLVKGIGPKFARRIVQAFGEETLNVIEDRPEELARVPGIGQTRVEMIRKSWAEQKEIKNIMLFLQGHDVSTAHATRIYKQYGADSVQVVQENPYRLADDIWGIGFKTADTIAGKLGFEKSAPVRLRSGLIYTLNKLAEEGHCYAVRDQLLETGARLLEAEAAALSETLDEMIQAEDVIVTPIPDTEDFAIYLPPLFYSETGVQNRLRSIREGSPVRPVQTQMETEEDIEYDEVQRQAIETARTSKIMILTGGPGTGKSTTTMGIIRAFRGMRILLAAPTGRAAKRLSEVTGMEAKTIHRLLEFKPPEGYRRREDNPLEGDLLIVDECSMVDIVLMYALLRAVPDSMRLILVGDVDQLPSVGAGNVLRDMIASGVFPVVTLTKIFRQAATSRIITNAHRINHGEYPDLSNGKGTDFFFQGSEDPEKAATLIVDLVRNRLPRYYGTDPQAIQVLTPMQRGAVGAVNLNQLLQAAVNPAAPGSPGGAAPELRRGGYAFRPGDKVMQIRNNYEKEVFNGDIGTIQRMDTDERTLTILFDDRSVLYDAAELDEIVLAYATTVHKAQGAEYPIVVMPVMMTHFTMLQRNLLYTGVTRARKALVLVGEKKAVAYCVKNVTVDGRNTLLAERLAGKTAPSPVLSLPPSAANAHRYVCFDVETPNARNDRMSAIGISVVENGRITEEFFSYVNPEEPFDSFNTELTGISAATVAGAPTFRELWPRIRPLLSGGTLAAHNAPFDMGVLKRCLLDYGISWKKQAPYVCTVRIGRAVLPNMSHRLNDMCRYYEIELDHHQADSDSHACAEILIRYLQAEVKVNDYTRFWKMT
ncbi:MAG: ATP-dependent RecD-like DNA helicase [Clostridia bacterium]|nr:ATP-dependent RecD-like DNA helicase [Clostridia bacterium]